MLRDLYINFENDYIDFWKLLNVNFAADPSIIEKNYSDYLNKNNIKNVVLDEYYVGWKLLKDKRFEKLYKNCKSLKEVYDAGFFLDSLNLGESLGIQNVRFLSLPLNKAIIDQKNGKKRIVLLTTGGFSPVHDGHINNLEIAKKHLEKNGYNVICGYLSPSHDDYVSKKDSGKAHNYAINRIKLCNKKIENSNWIMTSPQESIYTRTSINYTDVIDNLKKFLRHHVSEDIIIGYVFGGDNAPFVKAFSGEDLAICISRNNIREDFLKSKNKNNYNYFYIEENNLKDISSTKIRNNNNYNINNSKEFCKKNYLIRNDYSMFGFDEYLSPINDIKSIFEKYLDNCLVFEVDVLEQLKICMEKMKNKKTISLDVYMKGNYNVSLSRLFNHSDSQLKANGLIVRPEEDIKYYKEMLNIPKGEYTLIEDDIVSGFTFNYLKSILPKDVNIVDIILLSNLGENSNINYFDVVDLRDFIINTNYSGLVVTVNKKNIRVPYIAPYVDVHSRANISAKNTIKFSIDILNLNIKLYKKIKEKGLKIELTESTLYLCNLIGLQKEKNNIDTIIKFCKWHLNELSRVV